MKLPKLAVALSYLDDDLISEAVEYLPPQKALWLKWAGVAACFCLLVLVGLYIWQSGSPPREEPPREIRLSAFEVSPGNPNADAYGEDELFRVDVILRGNRLYTQMVEKEYAAFGIGEVLRETDFGTYLGVITELGENDAPLSSPCSQEPTLANCEVYLYAPVNCEAVIIVRGNGRCSLFRFADFMEDGHSLGDIYQVFGVTDSGFMKRIDYWASKPKGPIVAIYHRGSITAPEQLEAFFRITMTLQAYVREGPLSGDPEWLNIARKEFNSSSEDNRIYIEAIIVLKNGTSMGFSYQPTLGTGYVPGHYFFSEADNALLKEMFCPGEGDPPTE